MATAPASLASSKSKPILRPRLCAAVECRAAFRPVRKDQRFCCGKCRNRQTQARYQNRDEVEKALSVLRRDLQHLSQLLTQ